ncbi:hypothetical protein B7P43_G05627 [Cryptotermes secundus]|uniref:FHA domain-containing protein n=1 Tax=Cryptotermes secundus TaxID=105785 RepID=A0A2J7RFS9_9NEOP|nr:serine/arginine repetitive matrix protein 2 isoform X2 [Cryptotermes secundus]PNF39680.1 hypothetical protein B7P43_G05627 [Cryptotermes secundus]
MLTRGHLIIIKRDGKDGSVYPVTTTTCSVGRGLQNDIRIHVQSVSQEHCKIYTSDFQPAILKNLSSTNPTKVNNAPIGENEHHLEHGDVITTGERSFRWEYLPPSRYYRPTKAKTSPLRGSTGMVGMPISVLQSTLGTQSFNRRSGIVTERKIKLSPALMASSDQTPAKCDTSFSPSRRLVAIVSPQRRPQSEKKASRASAGGSRAPNQEDEGSSAVPMSGTKVIAQSRRQKSPVAAGPVTNVSSSADKTVAELRNQSSGKRMDSTPSSRKSSRLYSKSARKATESYNNVKIFQNSLVTNRKAPLVSSKARKSVGSTPLPKVSRIPTLVKSVSRLSRAKTPESAKTSRRSGGNLKKKKTPVSSVKTKKSEQKRPVAVSAEERKRKCESGLRSAERAAKRLKLESPKTPDKKKMAALLVCHGKGSRPKTPQLVVSSSPQRVTDTLKVKHKSRTPTSVPKSHGLAVQKTRRKKSENLRASSDGMTSAKDVFSLEISPNFKFDSDVILSNVSSGQRAENKERPLTSSQKSRRSRALKSEKTASPEPGKITDLSGVAELFNSPAKATSTRKRASLVSGDTVQTHNAVLSEGRHSSDNSVDLHTLNIFELQTDVSSGKKTPKSTARQSLFKSLMKKSIKHNSALIDDSMGNAETLGFLPDISYVGRESRSVSVGFPVTSEETNQSSSRKSRYLSGKWSSNSEPHSPATRKFSSSPELEQKVRPLTVSGTPVSEQTASRRSSRIGVHSPESVKSTSSSLSKFGSKGTSFPPGTPVSELSGSIRRSRSSIVTQSPKCDKSDLKSLPGTNKKGKSVSPSMSPYNKTASAMDLMDTGGAGSSPGSIVQNFTSTCLRMSSGSSAGTGKGAISVSGSSVSPKKPDLVKNLSSYLDEESPSSSGSRFKKSSERHVRTSSRSGFSLDVVSPQKSMLLQERKTRSSQKRIAHSSMNQTQSPTPVSQNTTFDFDSVRTPHIPVENLVSPLSSNRKRKSLGWQDISMILQKRNSEPAIKKRHISERVDGNVTFLNDSSVHPLSPQQLFSSSLIDEPIHTSRSAGQGWESYDNFSPGLKTCVSSKNASPYVHAIQNIKNMSPAVSLSGRGRIHRFSAGSRISQSFGNNMNNISGALQLMKTPSSPKSPVNDLPDVNGGEKLTTVRRTSKSPKDGLTDVHVVEQLIKDPRSPKLPRSELKDVCNMRRLTKTPGSPKSPKNGLRNVRGVRNVMKTLRSPKSPQNDLRDVRGVRNLMKTPRSPKSPKNDLRDVRGVRQLLKTPRSPKSPKNDLRDVRGVRNVMKTPRSPKSPQNDLRDVRGVRNLMKTPRSPKSPKNDLRDVRGVRNLMKTPRSPKSPKNDLRDVRGVRQLLKTPRSPKSPKNDLRDVRGVRNLLKTPRSPKSPRNDLRDVRGVRNLMKTPRSPKSPKNDLTDVRGVKRLMTTPQVTRSPKNDITDVDGVKELMETPRSGAHGLTDIDEHCLEKTPTSPSPRSGSRASLTHSKLKTPERYSVDGTVPSIATRTRHRQASGKTAPIKHSPKFIKTEVPEADRSDAEGSLDQKNISVHEEVKTNNARSRRNRKGPDLGIVKAEIADRSTTPRSKKRQKENKAQNKEDLSPEKHLDMSVESTDTSLSSARAQNRVHFGIPNSPDIPVAQFTRKKRGVVDAAVQQRSSPPGTRKTLRSKGSVKGESIAKEDINDQSVSLPAVRKTRGTKLTSAVEVASSPARRKRGAKVAADAESSPVPSKRRHGVIAQSNTEESSPPRTRRGTVTTGSELSSSPKRQQAVIVTMNAKPLPPRTRSRAIVSTETEIPESPVTKKTRSKLTLKTAVTSPPVATAVPQEDSFTSANKQLTSEVSPSPAGKRRKQTKAVEQSATKPARKLRGTKLSDVSEDETGPSDTKTRSRKPRIISSPVLKAKSPPVVTRRGGKRSAKREVSPEAVTERRTRASRRRK